MKSKFDFLIGVPLLAALLACGGGSEKVVIQEPDPEPVYVPASQPTPSKTKVRKTYPDGTTIETEQVREPPEEIEVDIDD